MKKNEKGFMLLETLIVTTFVAGVLILLFVQFSNLSRKYESSYKYNTVEGIYALDDIREYIEYEDFITYIDDNIATDRYIDITNCSLFKSKETCLNLIETENIDRVFVTTNLVPTDRITRYDEEFLEFINKINEEGDEPYRLVASFKNSTYATIRFGE